jgi:hypothetical protein
MFAHGCALRLLLCMDVTNLRLLHGKKMNVTYLNKVLIKKLYLKKKEQVGSL